MGRSLTALLVATCLFYVAVASSASINLKALKISGKILVAQLMQLASYSDDPSPSVTRILFTDNDLKGRRYIKHLMEDAGLSIYEDPIGNIYGRYQGTDPKAPSVGTGSHTDAIPLAGAYDGTVGVIGGIAALKALKLIGFKPKRTLEVVMFTSEEPTRFGLSCSGSRAMAGMLDASHLASLRDVNGSDFMTAAKKAGYGSSDYEHLLSLTRRRSSDLGYFVELHIEQGPLLGDGGLDIGIVTAIAAPAALRITFNGDGGHAGALLMPRRNDASLAAAELALFVEKAATSSGAGDTVATTGLWEVKPNAVNSVPREARLEIDVRDIDGPRRDSVLNAIKQEANKIAQQRRVQLAIDIINQDPPATCGRDVIKAVEWSAAQLGYTSRHMVSRAYHDSLFMAQIAPTGMIFIPCRNGWSHRPDEYASPADVEKGVKVLALTMAELAGDQDDDEKKVEL
jgi:ureidoglycolate amidohydrolase